MVETTKNSVATTAFPIYDAHGNQAARLYRSGTGWQVADRQSLDAWGVVRSQQSGTDGRMAYCASLGHQTAEYGLTYMRARYYEPQSGRFLSEDPDHRDDNWFVYVSNRPTGLVDRSGKAGDLGEEGAADSAGEELDEQDGGGAFNFKRIAEGKIHRIFSTFSRGGKRLERWQVSKIIHGLKESEGMAADDDLLFDFAKQMLGRDEGAGEVCLGTLSQVVEMFL